MGSDIIQNYDVVIMANQWFAYSIMIAGLLAVSYVMIAGFSLITSMGKDEKIKKGINGIRYVIVGLIIVILSFFGVSVIGQLFGLDFVKYIDMSEAVKIIQETGENPDQFLK